MSCRWKKLRRVAYATYSIQHKKLTDADSLNKLLSFIIKSKDSSGNKFGMNYRHGYLSKKNYRKLLQLIPTLNQIKSYAKLTTPGYMPLNVDILSTHHKK